MAAHNRAIVIGSSGDAASRENPAPAEAQAPTEAPASPPPPTAAPPPSRYVDRVSDATGLTARQLAARAVAVLAAASIPLLLLLPYASIPFVSPTTFVMGSKSATGWQTLNGSDIVMTVCSVLIVACVALDLFVAPGRWLGGAAAVAFAQLGLAWPDLLGLPISWAWGAYIVLLVAITGCVALVIAFRGPTARAAAPVPAAFRRSTP